MKHLGLFEGIGGFSLAARWMGWETVAWSEWNPFCQQILKYHFPKAEGYGDITKTDFTKYANKIDILTGGFPCQPFSVAGKQLGTEDERHLWPQMLRAIREIKPTYIVGENVRGLVNWDGGMVFEQVCIDLEAEGYEVQPILLPACAVNAPHRRDRIWFVAYSEVNRSSISESTYKWRECIENNGSKIRTSFNTISGSGASTDTSSVRHRRRNSEPDSNKPKESTMDSYFKQHGNRVWSETSGCSTVASNPNISPTKNTVQAGRDVLGSESSKWQNFPTQSPICGGDDGLPDELDGITFSKWRKESIKGFGNAIVPQVALQIFKALVAHAPTPPLPTHP